MSLYFRPEKGVLGDVIPFYDNGVFKPFYLRNYRGNRDANHQDSWVMLSTTDHVHFTEHDTKIVGGTGSVIKVDGIYHMFFCTFQDDFCSAETGNDDKKRLCWPLQIRRSASLELL